MNYGSTNFRGELCPDEINKILGECRKNGIKELDTAQAYGRAEEKLGKAGICDFSVTTKITITPHDNAESVQSKVQHSLDRLRLRKLENLLIHNEESLSLDNAEQVVKSLHLLVKKGLARQVGISSYDPKQSLALCEKYNFKVVQIPANVLDNRLFQEGLINRFIEKKIQVQIRSIFLQGVLLENPKSQHRVPNVLVRKAEQFRTRCRDQCYTPLQGALGHVWQAADRAKIVFGVTGTKELEQILKSLPQVPLDFHFPLADWRPEFDPRNWKVKHA